MSLNKTFNFLKNHRKDDLLMPTQKKNPKYPHKNNSWNWCSVIEHQDEFGNNNNCCILLKTMIVIDIDVFSLIEKYENMFPILKDCPQVETKKGKHYYFGRTSLCDFYNLYDRSRCFGLSGDEIDFKTICSTGTAGVVVIPPSLNKKWVRPIWKTPLPDFSGDIFDYFLNNWNNNKKKFLINYMNPQPQKFNGTDPNIHFPDKISLSDNMWNKIKNYVDDFSIARSTSYPTWIRVCCCLKNISAYYIDDEQFFKIWNNFSMKCTEKYKANETLNLWLNCIPRSNRSDINTLKLWALRDNPDKYLWVDFDSDLKISVISFINNFYNYDSSMISNAYIYKPENIYIIVDIKEDICPIENKKHDCPCVYIIIGNKNSKKKCRICDVSSYNISWTNRIDNFSYPQKIYDLLSGPTLPNPKNSQKCIIDFYKPR